MRPPKGTCSSSSSSSSSSSLSDASSEPAAALALVIASRCAPAAFMRTPLRLTKPENDLLPPELRRLSDAAGSVPLTRRVTLRTGPLSDSDAEASLKSGWLLKP